MVLPNAGRQEDAWSVSSPNRSAPLNIQLSFGLALKSVSHHWLIALVTILGISLGVAVVGAILIVDNNTVHEPAHY